MYTLMFRSNLDKWEFENRVREVYGDGASIKGDSLIIEDRFERYHLGVNVDIENFKCGDYIQHFKGGQYKIIGECKDATTNKDMFIYIALNSGDVWCRPKEEFYDLIEPEKNTLMWQPYRFVRV